MSPSTETNGQSFLRRLGPTKGCRTNDDDDDDDDDYDLSTKLHGVAFQQHYLQKLLISVHFSV
jgi:hypothetical protein